MARRVRLTLSLLAIVIGVALLDLATPSDYAFSLFYLLAIVAAAWWVGRAAGLLVATASAGAWFLVELVTHPSEQGAALFWNSTTRTLIFMGAAYLVSREHTRVRALESEKARAFRLAITDDVTGLYNRHFMAEEGNRLVALAIRHRRPFSIVAISVAGGRSAPDRVLRAAARMVTELLPEGDLAIRVGGASLAAVLPEAGETEAAALGRAVEAAAGRNLELTAREVRITTAAATWRFGQSFEDVVDEALSGLRDVA